MSNKKTASDLDRLILAEGWSIEEKDNTKTVVAFGKEFPHCHPVAIHNSLYRNEKNPQLRYNSMKAVHDYYWPHLIPTWNYWEEEIFFAHCENWKFIVLAAGASAGKSHTVAKICLQSYFSDPTNNAAVVASTTLSSLNKRVLGYIVRLLHECKIPLNFTYTKSPTPQILVRKEDEIHSISGLAAGVGTEEGHVRNYLGRHPNKKLLLLLDEAPDLSPVVMKAVSNLEAGEDKLQVWVIGNSLSKSDLHGALATPKNGWDSVSYQKDIRWETTQPDGLCLYFSPHRSPAIHETDPEKKILLSKFLITAQQIEVNKQKYGENSIDFWRMTLGFWLDAFGGESTFTTKPFLENFNTTRNSLWSGLHPLRIVGGLDPAFSTGGDSCVLRLGVLGHSNNGQVVLDFRDNSLVFKLKMMAKHRDPIDIQIADQIIDILKTYNAKLEDVSFDCTGQGRTFPELVRLRAAAKGIQWLAPLKIWHARSSAQKNNQDVLVKSPTELWENLKDYIQTNQIAGLDAVAFYQMTSRLLVYNKKTHKRELEPKLEYRNRMNAINPGKGSSPDEADAAALCLFTAIHRHGFYKEQVKALEQKPDFFADKYNLMQRAEMKAEQQVKLMPLKATYGTELVARKTKIVY